MSKITNSKKFLAGVDMRTEKGRRYRDLVRSYAEGLGLLDERQKSLVRSAAGIGVHLEHLQAEILNGCKVDTRLLVRLANAQTRALAALHEAQVKASGEAKAESSVERLQAHLRRLAAKT
jgi:hypothetical protein